MLSVIRMSGHFQNPSYHNSVAFDLDGQTLAGSIGQDNQAQQS